MRLAEERLRAVWERDRRRERRRLGLTLAVAAAAFLLCLCFRYNAYYYADKLTPLENLKSLWLALRLLLARLADSALYARRDELIGAVGSIAYYGALARLRITLVSFAAGAGLALAGAIFQTAYRNPMASPNIIGAAAGVDLGNALVVMLFSARAYENILLRYEYCYGLTVLCVGLVLLLGKLAGGRGFGATLMETVMAGSIVSQTLRVFSMYIVYELPDEDILLYEEIKLGTYIDTGAVSMALFFGVMTLSVLPVLLTRFRLNALALDAGETASVGLRSGGLRLTAQICGVLMVTCAMIHCGEVGMISLVVPYAVRRFIGSDFRKLCVYSLLWGGVLLMLCQLAASFVMIADTPLPVSFVIELALTPVFMVILAKGRKNDEA